MSEGEATISVASTRISLRRGDQSAQIGFVCALGDAYATTVGEHQLNAGSAAWPRRFREPTHRLFVQNAGDEQPPCRYRHYRRTSGCLVAAHTRLRRQPKQRSTTLSDASLGTYPVGGAPTEVLDH
jgi:hypothetical protein